MGRRKNPHPQRAVNARTVLKVNGKREEREKEGEEQPPVLCLRIPDEDEFEANQKKKKKKKKREKKREKKQTKTWSNCGGFSCACRATMSWSKIRRGKTTKE